jgi:hypothetical protein
VVNTADNNVIIVPNGLLSNGIGTAPPPADP